MKKLILVAGVVAVLIAIAYGAFNSSTSKSTNNEGIVLATDV